MSLSKEYISESDSDEEEVVYVKISFFLVEVWTIY